MIRLTLAAVGASLLLGGCAELPTSVRNEEIAYQAIKAVDEAQTLRIADTPEKFHELNPLLGPHPSPGKVAAYFAISDVAHYGATVWLSEHAPPWVVHAWEAAGIGLEIGCVGLNVDHGISPTLSFHVNH